MSTSSHVRFCLFVAWNIRTVFFFPFLFLGYFCSIASAVSPHCGYSLLFFYVIFESLYWRTGAVIIIIIITSSSSSSLAEAFTEPKNSCLCNTI